MRVPYHRPRVKAALTTSEVSRKVSFDFQADHNAWDQLTKTCPFPCACMGGTDTSRCMSNTRRTLQQMSTSSCGGQDSRRKLAPTFLRPQRCVHILDKDALRDAHACRPYGTVRSYTPV
jgi:hypothetical protein